ncbi:MAG: cytochrome C oxidase subunit IV family protein [Saprospiraceae bacterium]|nr:cytochrome C oxidase subunit IV family protein [Saprospiraceae bacterium]
MSLSPEEGKKVVYRGMVLLGVITLCEVIIALLGNGHIIEGFHLHKYIMFPAMIILSLYKAYYIVSEFMHMKYETRGLVISALWPIVLLIWAMIALLNEGGAWHHNRQYVELIDRDGFKKPDSYSLDEYLQEVSSDTKTSQDQAPATTEMQAEHK